MFSQNVCFQLRNAFQKDVTYPDVRPRGRWSVNKGHDVYQPIHTAIGGEAEFSARDNYGGGRRHLIVGGCLLSTLLKDKYRSCFSKPLLAPALG